MPTTKPRLRAIRNVIEMTLDAIARSLREAGIDNAAFEARVIAEHFTGMSSAVLLARRTEALPHSDELERAVARRVAREPLQYIIGRWDFMGLAFSLTPDCLIPRADTELLCETAIELLPHGGSVLDLCTGSGCIAAAVACHREDAHVTALELSPRAAKVAHENFRCLTGDRVRLVIDDALSAEAAEEHFERESFDVIVSNPPYITSEEMRSLEAELSCEPECALTDGGDGLSFYRRITEIYPSYLKRGGVLAFEHGCLQGEAVRQIISAAGYRAETRLDIEGRERVTLFKKQA